MDSLPGGHPNIDVCPMQTNGIDCGYFVMRFMKEIILANQDMIPENYFGDYKCKTYSKDKLVEVEEDWTTFMVECLIIHLVMLATSWTYRYYFIVGIFNMQT
ncbi:transmembrane protein, putative [Medicago truncatula]|uniref:Transmembrane protein, putative n=1 Tax=Medicago truncatula TaxID=3880 RepID=G7KX65_MEDTR|nr:transmembrane protein, putative [Medicago truncatula]